MKFLIPKSLYLGGTKIEIKLVEKCRDTSKDTDGQACYADGVIEIKIGNEDGKFSDQYKECVFFHELVHHILNSMGENEMRSNEKFVSLFATFLHQAIVTMEENK